MICLNCGNQIGHSVSFCGFCGSPVTRRMDEKYNSAILNLRIGFSDKINDPAILKALKKNKKATGILGIVLLFIPILVALGIAIKEDNFEHLIYGVIISAIFLVINLFSLIKKKMEKQWDGVVIDKTTEVKQNSSSEDGFYSTYTLYITKIRKDNGGIKKIKERKYNRFYYDYLQPGERVRYHPQFNCYYEKFDKSRDDYVICPICNGKNEISRDICGRCGVPVIK